MYGVWDQGRESKETNHNQLRMDSLDRSLNGRENVSLECMNFPDEECRIVLYGVVKIWKLVGESSDFMDWQEVRERSNGQIRRDMAIYLSFCIDNCIENSNRSYFRSLEKNQNRMQNKHINMSEQTIKN